MQHREEAEKFYRDLAVQGMKVCVGMEASGHARWFERLLAELNIELWIGDAAEIRRKRPEASCRLKIPSVDFQKTLPTAFARRS